MGRGLIATVAAVLMFSGVAAADWKADLKEARKGGADGSIAYRNAGEARRIAEKVWFAALFTAARTGSTDAVKVVSLGAGPLGFRARVDGSLLVITEDPSDRRGAGAYVIRIGPAAELYVQAPHTFSDVGTGELAIALFERAHARALFVNTVHRRGKAGEAAATDEDSPPPQGSSDVAHDEESTFHSATLAALGTVPGSSAATLIQLHGFADRRVEADVVLSQGKKGSGAPVWLNSLKSDLSRALPDARIAAYPDDVERLGARANVQGKAARRHAVRFVHVELGASLRARLKDDPTAFLDAVVGALGATNDTAER